MPTAREREAFKGRMALLVQNFNANAQSMGLLADDVDYVSERGIEHGPDRVSVNLAAYGALRKTAEVISMTWLDKDIVLVDSVAEDERRHRIWFSEIWRRGELRDYSQAKVTSMRIRHGSPDKHFESLSRARQRFVSTAGTRRDDEEALRAQFKAFRTAFNNSDSKGVVALFTAQCDAIPVFSFLNGRAQIIKGRAAVGAKANRMGPPDRNIDSDPQAKGASFVTGEPKLIRFMSDTVAVVDGTAEIGNIPKGHGFAPADMTGVYTDMWKKSSAGWRMQGSRAWF
jgi:hypothetical protein